MADGKPQIRDNNNPAERQPNVERGNGANGDMDARAALQGQYLGEALKASKKPGEPLTMSAKRGEAATMAAKDNETRFDRREKKDGTEKPQSAEEKAQAREARYKEEQAKLEALKQQLAENKEKEAKAAEERQKQLAAQKAREAEQAKEGTFSLKPNRVLGKDDHGHATVSGFEKLPVEEVTVRGDGKMTLNLSHETAVRKPDDPQNPDVRNREVRFGKIGADGRAMCDAQVTTRTDAEGNINHITLDKPTNLQVSGEQFLYKEFFGKKLGAWTPHIAGDVTQAVFDNTSGKPQAIVSFTHPTNGIETTRETMSQVEFNQLANWIRDAKSRALPTGNIMADVPNQNPRYARD